MGNSFEELTLLYVHLDEVTLLNLLKRFTEFDFKDPGRTIFLRPLGDGEYLL